MKLYTYCVMSYDELHHRTQKIDYLKKNCLFTKNKKAAYTWFSEQHCQFMQQTTLNTTLDVDIYINANISCIYIYSLILGHIWWLIYLCEIWRIVQYLHPVDTPGTVSPFCQMGLLGCLVNIIFTTTESPYSGQWWKAYNVSRERGPLEYDVRQ